MKASLTPNSIEHNIGVLRIKIVLDASRSQIKSKMFYRQFSIVKYLYLPTDTFRKHVERHVTWRKLALKFTGYCRQSRYTDSAVVFTLLPAVAWDLKSQFPPGYMHFNIMFWRRLWGDMNILRWKITYRIFLIFFAFIGLCNEPGLLEARNKQKKCSYSLDCLSDPRGLQWIVLKTYKQKCSCYQAVSKQLANSLQAVSKHAVSMKLVCR